MYKTSQVNGDVCHDPLIASVTTCLKKQVLHALLCAHVLTFVFFFNVKCGFLHPNPVKEQNSQDTVTPLKSQYERKDIFCMFCMQCVNQFYIKNCNK